MTHSKFIFKIYYIGRDKYYGSQRQPYFLTIEQGVINALKKRGYIHEIENSNFEFASRTDRYVSARGACFMCITEKEPILMEINSALPTEIGVWAYSEVPIDFSARYDAVLRHYVYIVPLPISYFKKISGINIKLMKKACRELEGRHDFSNFSKKGTDEINTVRDLDSVHLSIQEDYLFFQFKSRSFLRQQVRRMVKKVLELGIGKLRYEDFLALFDTSKEISYQPADPKGLILWDIKFNENVSFIYDPKSEERMNSLFITKKLDYNLKYHLFRALQQDYFS
ncbi:MAG: tRNA pseudouridine synthase A [Promethearchaeota archaeon]